MSDRENPKDGTVGVGIGADRRALGERTRRATLGDAHVDRSMGGRTAFDAPFVGLVTEAAWGTVWADGTIPPRERSMVTLALLAGLGNWEEFALHLRATARTGASREDVAQVLQHVAIYAGVPRANRAHAVARAVFAEMDEQPDDRTDGAGEADASGGAEAFAAEMREEDA